MIGLLQRVTQASVSVNQAIVGQIETGLLVLLGVEKTDTTTNADRLLERLLTYRVFADEQGKMNISLRDIKGGLLIVPQFTLPADTRKGTRPSFSTAASPELGLSLFQHFCAQAHLQHATVACGVFGADMQVTLINNGPVTFWLQV
ncbi:D-aminoacyl-tRNA deacylase [Beggiatoa leptomitoformis]|uniref:D-aminoacyl-tRNA deacylase n=1 Tax=Beggiatoa leptomitoformis TaxID=288004 RepID=A0A2N9YEN7_9GAMM|nr:D-aminoacyl-tRNA deacylase [Beggiatoa leptomitoformis]ALG68735.1 D-tyrosyl-tRNA(Tyr) deacylase [Beggiatoa leptomitoformis]AUI68906.1 D-tyrosyl-tRNA(Tyr) deacylase [Beggiatoa leptomitoformis]